MTPEAASARILIVDDREENILLFDTVLRRAGYVSITSTTDPTLVRGLYLQNRFDLILLDLQMPRMSGLEVMEGLNELEPGGYLPILVVSAEPGHKGRALKAGAKDFVAKPFSLALMTEQVRTILEACRLHRLAEAKP